jgi:DNA-binding NtrC family response regulator
VVVRFLAATNRQAAAMLASGELREDLYYRLRGFEIPLPPLHERRSDVPLLAAHFLGANAAGFAPDAMEALVAAPWPGNVRQLRHVVQSAAVAARGQTIRARHLSLDSASPARSDAVGPLRGTLRDVERRAILQALTDADGNRSRAARLLDIDRSTLRRKMKEYGIEP